MRSRRHGTAVGSVAGKLLGALPLAWLSACNSPTAETAPASSASAVPRASADAPAQSAPAQARLRELLAAEHRRDSRAVTHDDSTHRDPAVRRAAARALARIVDPRARGRLQASLADEDPEVIAFSAYGLGYGCPSGDVEAVRALSMRAASLLSAPPAQGRLDPLAAIADALGRCGTADAERTLRAWLAGSPALAEQAALALGQLASRRGRLDDSSLVALLDAASRREGRVASALFAFTRLTGLGPSVRTRLLEVARANAATPGVAGALALRALGAAGEEAAPALGEALRDRKRPAPLRSEAARSLGRLALPGQVELRAALPGDGSAPLRGPDLPVLIAVLDALESAKDAVPALERLAELPLPNDPVEQRHAVGLRCRAAALLAGRATLSARLRACDPDPNGRAAALAQLRVLDRGKLEGARYRRFRELLEAKDSVIRKQALGLLAGHPEAADAPLLLASALARATPSDVTVAAELLAKYPDRAGAPHPDVVSALTRAIETTPEHALEARAALIDASAALGLLSSKSRIEAACGSHLPVLREHAEKALELLGARGHGCTEFVPAKEAPEELARLVRAPQHVELETDAGTLRLDLDPYLAPVAVTRFVELAAAGFYDGMAVHRVVPGFVAQFGDRAGDGYGAAPRPPLRCETSPVPFEELAVGVALGGRDTGSSQFFVTLGRFPHLDGEYAWVGKAQGPWQALTEGDVIRKVRVNATR